MRVVIFVIMIRINIHAHFAKKRTIRNAKITQKKILSIVNQNYNFIELMKISVINVKKAEYLIQANKTSVSSRDFIKNIV